MKKLLGILIVGLLWSNVGKTESSDKVGMTHELGLQITGYYSYDEPEYIYNRSKLENQLFDNFGLIYNFKNSFLVNEFLTEFELDTDFRRIKYDYWSNSSGTRSNMDNDVFNLRALYGFKLTDKLMLKSGLGYRSLKDPGGGGRTSKNYRDFDRVQEYRYIPFLAEINMPISSIDGKLKIEFDHIFYGYLSSLLSVGGGTNRDIHNRNDDGYAWKTSYKFPFEGFYLEPYYEFMSIEESNNPTGSWYEPSNTTKEYGIKISKRFGKTETKKIGTQITGNTYTGEETVKYLATGVRDRAFFATNKSVLTTASRDTLRKQAAWLKKNKDINVTVEGHADERGPREYNLALGEKRANAAKDYLMAYGISNDRIPVISYGKERPVNSDSNPLAWSQNRRPVLSTATGSKRLLQGSNYFSDKFYYGLNYFRSKIDSGVTLVSGGSLDEKDSGYSILSGFEVNDFLDIEIGFNEFGQSLLAVDANTTFKTDGRYRHGTYASGELITGVDNAFVSIMSHSGSLAIKPKYNFGNGLFINADLGIHRWTQTEQVVVVGSTNIMYDYSSYDTFYGIGAGIKKDNFEVSVNYKDYDMYYDATIIGASIKYNF